MKREIKFRVWDIHQKQMTTGLHYLVLAKAIQINRTHYYIDNEPSGAIIMQYTGLKDKNGKEIYEGDIIEQDEYDRFIVEYGEQSVDAFMGMGFNLWGFYGDDYTCERLSSEIEIIGNIYENPELI